MKKLVKLPLDFTPLEGYQVASWSPGDASKGDPVTQVHVIFDIPEAGGVMIVRLKSRRAIQEMIDTLVAHRDDVWPEEEQAEVK